MSRSTDKQIVRILRVKDTRVYEEGPDEKWYPIPGSGVENECARCGRTHEVHATVELADGTKTIVGTGCMGAKSLSVEARKLATTAATRARSAARLAHARKVLAAYDKALAAVQKKRVPPVRFKLGKSSWTQGLDKPIPTLTASVGKASVQRWLQFEPDSPRLRRELEQSAINEWKLAYLKARGFTQHRYHYEALLEHAERLARRAGVI